ncbi:glutathione S-transferase F13-like [Papaver somniferum]|uniref:glutathione S-transferase F13-like n=1 Tax=Papaver somniferum TaxID=3469 RepID=UPI000E6FEB6D|nr:glutathione S-transferase F13-like [Papaver somniferum]
MALKVHGLAKSMPVSCVMLCLAEKELDFEFVHVNFSKGEHKSHPFLSKNPFGKIPVFEDGPITLFESRAITGYIAHKYKDIGTDLFRHGNIQEAAMVGVWMEVESQHFSPPTTAIIYEMFVGPIFGHTIDQSVVNMNIEKLDKVLDVYEARLSTSKYLACDSFSLADLHHLPNIYYLMKITPCADLINSRAHVKAWWEDISARPSFVKVAQGLTLGE